MAPFLRDEGPPVSKDTIQRARESLPVEYGNQLVNETGREVLLVRVPKAKPDYLHDLGDVAFYVSLDMIRNCKDILLIGHEKTARLEPQLLRDNIRAQDREDQDLVSDLRRRLGRDYAYSILQSPSNHLHQALAVRIPRQSANEFSADDVKAIREVVQQNRSRFESCQYAYVVADRDHERLGRRVLLDLIGQPASAGPMAGSAPQSPPSTPATPTAAAPAAHGSAFPPTPGTTPARAAGASAVPASSSSDGNTLPGFLAARAAPEGTAAHAAPAPNVGVHIPGIFAAAVATTAAVTAQPAAPAPSAPVGAPLEVSEQEEYTIISKPKAAPPPEPLAPPTPDAAPTAPQGATVEAHEEYEIVSKPKPVEAVPEPAATAPVAASEPERTVSKATEEFEVYTSKPKTTREPSSGITPPGMGGFQNALAAATSTQRAPAKTKEYEISGGGSASAPAPTHFAPQALARAPAPTLVRDDPRIQPVMQARAPASAPAGPDNGAVVTPAVALAAPELILEQRFREAGYDIVEGLRAQGTQFTFAAHKPNGRRVLVKRATDFAAEDAATLAQLVTALGADICVVVADRTAPGTRLATWGTRIEVYAPGDVPGLAF